MWARTPEQVLQLRRLRETAVLFALFVVPGLTSSATVAQVAGRLAPLAALTLRNIAFGLLVVYLLDIQGERRRFLGKGLRTRRGTEPVGNNDSPRGTRPLATTLLVWVVLLGSSLAVSAGATVFGFSGAETNGTAQVFAGLEQRYPAYVWIPLLTVAMLSVGFVEELFFRAYLITRMEQMDRPAGHAVLFAALLFSVGHGYQGGQALFFSLVAGVLLGVLWLRRGRLLPFALGHAAYNLSAIALSAWLVA